MTKLNPQNDRRVMTPFAGFYESVYWADFGDEVNDYSNRGMTEAQAEYLTDIVMRPLSQVAENAIAKDYTSELNSILEATYGIKDLLSDAIVHPMTMQNTGDQISVVIDVDKLPILYKLKEVAATKDIDFEKLLIQIAADTLTSGPGFISFYNPDIERLFNWQYDAWDDAYIECLLLAMLAVPALDESTTDVDETDWSTALYEQELHKFYEDAFQDKGGVMEYVFGAMTGPQHDEYNLRGA